MLWFRGKERQRTIVMVSRQGKVAHHRYGFAARKSSASSLWFRGKEK
jgi:hypothetical protein